MEHIQSWQISNMSCGHCVGRVQKALAALAGVDRAAGRKSARPRWSSTRPCRAWRRSRPPSTPPDTRPRCDEEGPMAAAHRRTRHDPGRRDDVRGLPGTRAEGAGGAAGRARCLGEPDDGQAPRSPSTRRSIAPTQLVQAIRDTGYEAELPAPVVDVVAEQDARDQAQDARIPHAPRARPSSVGVAGAVAMVGVDAAHDGAHGRTATRPVHAWVMDWLTPPLQPSMPWLYAVDCCCRGCSLALRHGVGGPPVLRPRVGRPAAPHGRHEHADRRRHGRGVPLLGDRHGRAVGSSPRAAWRPTSTTKP